MEDRGLQGSPQVYARIGGALYLVIIAVGALGEAVVRGSLVVPGDAAATADRIRSAENLWRAGSAGEFLLLICAVAVALILHRLLRPVSRDLSLLAVFFNLVSISVEAVSGLFLWATLFPLGKAAYLGAFEPRQLEALAYLSTRSHGYGFGVSLIFFGCVCIIWGYLIFRSRYLPRAVGILMQVAGLCYLANSFALILAPWLADRLYPAVLLPPFVGELSLSLWLLVKGVDPVKWREQGGSGAPAGDGA